MFIIGRKIRENMSKSHRASRMGNFIKARVIKNEEGAKYEGIIFTRFLTLAINENLQIEVFDEEPISGDLQAGETYEFLLDMTLRKSFDSLQIIDKLEQGVIWQGCVLAVNWKPEGKFSYHLPGLLTSQRYPFWILIEMDIGRLLVETKHKVKEGQLVRWNYEPSPFLSLIAVV